MAQHLRYRLSNAEKDALLSDQAVLIDALAARIRELEAKLLSPKKTSKNSDTPPSAGHKANAKSGPSAKKRPRPSRPGASRKLAESPDEIRRQRSTSCGGCGTDVSGQRQHIRHRYDHIDLPPIAPHTTRVELFGGRCAGCGARFRAAPPDGMAPGTPFGPNIHALLLYLHHSHHVGFQRLSRVMDELFGLKISEGAIANAFQRLADPLETSRAAIRAALRESQVIASDETTVNSEAKCNTGGRFGICLMHNGKRCRHVELYASHAQRERSDRRFEDRWVKHPNHRHEAWSGWFNHQPGAKAERAGGRRLSPRAR